MIQLGWSISRLLGPLLKTGLPFVKNVIKSLAESVLISLGVTTAVSGADVAIHKKILGPGIITLIISNEEMEHVTKIVEPLEDSDLLLKGVGEKFQTEAKEQKGEFLGILLGILGASLLGNMLKGKGIIKAGYGSKGSLENKKF